MNAIEETRQLGEYVKKYHDYVPDYRNPRKAEPFKICIELDPVTARHLYDNVQSVNNITPRFPTNAREEIVFAILNEEPIEKQKKAGEDISQWLKEAREKAGETKEETAKALHINTFLIEQYEAGTLRASDYDIIEFSKHFSHSKEDFLQTIMELFHISDFN